MKILSLGPRDVAEPTAPLDRRPARAQHWPKGQRATDTPSAHRLVGAAHEHALVLQAMPARLRGGVSVFALGMLFGALMFWSETLVSFTDLFGSVASNRFGYAAADLCMGLFGAGTGAIAMIAALRFLRIDLFSPRQIPLVFNRATRTVYRFVPDVPAFALYGGGWRGVWLTLRQIPAWVASTFTPWPMLLIAYDWDCLEAEYREEQVLSNNVMRTVRHLDLLVREAPGAHTLIGHFALAPALMTGEPMARALWEHVRRFMDEGGPALAPGDQPAPPPPQNAWQAANALMGLGWVFCLAGVLWTRQDLVWAIERFQRIPDYHGPAYMSFGVFTVIFLSYFFGAWVLFAVIAHFTSPDVPLPARALEGAGAPLALDTLAVAQPATVTR